MRTWYSFFQPISCYKPSSEQGSAGFLQTSHLPWPSFHPLTWGRSTQSCLPKHSYPPPHTSGPILSIQYRESCNHILRIHGSNSPGSLGGKKKGHFFSQECILPLDTSKPASSISSGSFMPGPLLSCWPYHVPSVPLGCTQVSAPTLLAAVRQALPPGCTPGQPLDHCEQDQTPGLPKGAEGNASSLFTQPTWRTNFPSAPVEHSFQTVLLMSRRNKTMCIYCVISTDLTKAIKAAMKQQHIIPRSSLKC